MPLDVLSRRGVPVVVLAALVCAAITSTVPSFSTIAPFDLEVYRAAGYSLLHGISLYGDSFPHNLPFTYPPFAAWPFVLLTPLPWGLTAWLWNFATLALLAWVIVVSFDRVLPSRPWLRALAVSGLLIAFGLTSPMVDHLGFGQINVLLMAMCLADLLGIRPKWLPAGVLIGLAAAVKLVPGLFIVYLLVTRRFRAALVASVTAAAATLAALVVSPSDSRLYFTDLLWHLDARVGLNNNATIGNQSLQGTLLRLLPGDDVRPVWLLLSVLALIVGMWAARRAYVVRGELAGAAVTGLVAVLISPVSWPHHLVWLVPAVAVLVGDGKRWLPLLAGVAVWLALLARTHRLGQEVVDAYPAGGLRVAGEVLRSSFVLICVAVIAALGRPPRTRLTHGADDAHDAHGRPGVTAIRS